MSDNSRYGGAHLLFAFLSGAAIGAAVGYLTAPASGRETRDRLKGWAGDARETAVRVPHALREAYDRASRAAKDAFLAALKDETKEG